jgi:hypothetical protein
MRLKSWGKKLGQVALVAWLLHWLVHAGCTAVLVAGGLEVLR